MRAFVIFALLSALGGTCASYARNRVPAWNLRCGQETAGPLQVLSSQHPIRVSSSRTELSTQTAIAMGGVLSAAPMWSNTTSTTPLWPQSLVLGSYPTHPFPSLNAHLSGHPLSFRHSGSFFLFQIFPFGKAASCPHSTRQILPSSWRAPRSVLSWGSHCPGVLDVLRGLLDLLKNSMWSGVFTGENKDYQID